MAKIRSNEILDKALSTDASVIPRFDITDALGNVLATNVALTLKNPVIQKGMAVDKLALDECLAASGTTTGTGSALVLTQENFVLFDGACVRFRLHTMPIPGDDGKTYLNINNTGNKAIMSVKGRPLKGLAAGNWVTAIYSEPLDFFVLQGEGGDTKRFGNGINQVSTYELMLVGHFSPYYGR